MSQLRPQLAVFAAWSPRNQIARAATKSGTAARSVSLIGRSERRGLTLIPTRIYFKGPHAKVELALARGKEQRNRRREIRDRDVQREVEREHRRRLR